MLFRLEGKLGTTGVHDLESILGVAVRVDAKMLVGPLPLCQEHYGQMYLYVGMARTLPYM